jgi:hypothetical protein
MKSSSAIEARYSSLLSDLTNHLRSDGFRGRPAWVLDRPKGAVVVDVQKGSASNSAQLLFAVNIGVVCRILLSSDEVPSKELRIEDCHWRSRLKMEGGHGAEWWVLLADSDPLLLSLAVANGLRSDLLPEALTLTDPLALRDLWLSGLGPGLTEAERLMTLIRLLVNVGPQTALEAVGHELTEKARGQAYWPAARAALRNAGVLRE